MSVPDSDWPMVVDNGLWVLSVSLGFDFPVFVEASVVVICNNTSDVFGRSVGVVVMVATGIEIGIELDAVATDVNGGAGDSYTPLVDDTRFDVIVVTVVVVAPRSVLPTSVSWSSGGRVVETSGG